MATRGLVLTTAPQDVKGGLSLSTASSFTLQNISLSPMFLHESSTAPNNDEDDVIVLSSGQLFNYTVGAENLYAWVRSGESSNPRLVVTGA